MKETIDDRVKRIERVLLLGKEDSFFLAWGRTMAWMAEKKIVLFIQTFVIAILASGLVFVSFRAERHRSMVIAVDERTGKAIPVNPAQYFQPDNSVRGGAELKGFSLEWVRMAYSYNFLNNRENWSRALRFVDSGAQASARFALQPRERKELTDRGFDVRLVEGDPQKGEVLEASLDSQDPAIISVVFRRVATNTTGQEQQLPVLRVRLELITVPRSPSNPHGLMITDVSCAVS